VLSPAHSPQYFPVRQQGDPFYFENALDRTDVRMVKNTTLSDIITHGRDQHAG
jgi:hypothetical protein